ncbi:MAG: H-NS histone family protein [Rubrivivax sp.]|nr:H-NS histone family protein [Rubrivivax sp.]
MTKTYQQYLKQIHDLQAKAEKARRAEAEGVITRIREAISHYGLTAADLGLSGGGGSAAPKAARGKPGRKPGRPRKVAAPAAGVRKVAPKYRDEHGNTWAGRGKRPVWLRDALAGGRKLEDFAIK